MRTRNRVGATDSSAPPAAPQREPSKRSGRATAAAAAAPEPAGKPAEAAPAVRTSRRVKRAPTIYGASDSEDGTVEDAPPSAKRRAIEQPTNPPGGNRARTPQSLPKNAGRADKAKALTTPLPAFADKLDVTPTADGQRSDALPHAPAKTDMGPLGPFAGGGGGFLDLLRMAADKLKTPAGTPLGSPCGSPKPKRRNPMSAMSEAEEEPGGGDEDDEEECDGGGDEHGTGDRRNFHNARERMRRVLIRDLFSALRDAVPGLAERGICADREILVGAAERVAELNEDGEALQRELEQQRQHNDTLQSQLQSQQAKAGKAARQSEAQALVEALAMLGGAEA